MNLPWEGIAGFAGATGVGALLLLGVFLFIDGRAPDTFATVEFYAKTATWGIVAAVPVLTIAYIVGLLSIGFTQWLSQIVAVPFFNDGADFVKVASLQSNAVTQRYLALRQDQEILSGSAIAFVVLALGALSEIRNLPQLRKVIYVASFGAVVAAIACSGLAVSKARGAHAVANAAYSLSPPKDTPAR